MGNKLREESQEVEDDTGRMSDLVAGCRGSIQWQFRGLDEHEEILRGRRFD
jgi:hypothetical protein